MTLNRNNPLLHFLLEIVNLCRLKPHQIHDLAAAKEKEMEKVRRAFGIREDYAEGDAFKRMKDRTTEQSRSQGSVEQK
jgi:hypothetical protein